jgi:hypothetical protein
LPFGYHRSPERHDRGAVDFYFGLCHVITSYLFILHPA